MKKLLLFFITISTIILSTIFLRPTKEAFVTQTEDKAFHRCEEGTSKHYDLAYESKGRLKFDAGKINKSQSNSMQLTWQGTLISQCLSDTEEKSLVYLQQSNSSWQDNFSYSKKDKVVDDLESGIYLVLKKKEVLLKSDRSLSLMSQNIFLQLALLDAYCQSPETDSEKWACHEKNPLDYYQSSYTRKAKEVRKLFQWQDKHQSVYQSSISYVPNLIVGQHKQEQSQGIANYQGQINITRKFMTQKQISKSDLSLLLSQFSFAKNLEFKHTTSSMQTSKHTPSIPKQRYQELLTSSNPTGQDYLDMVQWLRQEPTPWQDLEDRLLNEPFNENSKMWLKALSKESSSEAQSLLRNYIEQAPSKTAKNFSIVSLAISSKPDESSENFLRKLMKSPSSDGKTAAYSLGIMANHSPRREGILHELIQKLKQESADLSVILKAIGNIKNAPVIEHILPYTQHTNRQVRMDAIFALRFMPDSFPVLLKFLKSDSASMSSQASSAIAYQLNSPATLSLILKQWSRIPSVKTRHQLIGRILASKHLDDELFQQLRVIASEETSEKISQKITDTVNAH